VSAEQLLDDELDAREDTVCDYPGCVHGDEIERDRWGRPRGPWLEAGEDAIAIRMSTMSKAATYGDPGGLMGWAAARAVEGVLRDRGAADAARIALSTGDEKAVRAAVERASVAGGSNTSSERGTALHEAIVADLQGSPLDLLDADARRSVSAARVALDRAGLRVILAEQFGVLVSDDLVVAGTYDLLVEHVKSGAFRVVDIKTSAKLNDRRYPLGVSAQVAGYARMRRYCPRVGWLRDPEIDLDLGYLLSVPIDAGEAFLDRLDLQVGWTGLRLGHAVREWQSCKPLTVGAGE
jgi:hypothetical protein